MPPLFSICRRIKRLLIETRQILGWVSAPAGARAPSRASLYVEDGCPPPVSGNSFEYYKSEMGPSSVAFRPRLPSR